MWKLIKNRLQAPEGTEAPTGGPVIEAGGGRDEDEDIDYSLFEEGNDVVAPEDPTPASTPEPVAPPVAQMPTPTPPPAMAIPAQQAGAPAPTAPPVNTPALGTQPAAPASVAPTPATPAPAQPTQPPVNSDAWRADLFNHAVKSIKLTDEEIGDLTVAPEKVIPQLLAQTQVRTFEATFNAVLAHMPQMVQAVITQQNERQAVENEFFSAYPELRNHAQEAWQLAAAYRQSNPAIGKEQLMKVVGNSLYLSKGLTPPGIAAPAPTPAPVRPFVPSQGGGAPAAPKPSTNIFEQFAEELLVDDM